MCGCLCEKRCMCVGKLVRQALGMRAVVHGCDLLGMGLVVQKC